MTISYQPMDICSRSYETFTIIYDLRNKQILQFESVSADIWTFIISKGITTLEDITNHILNLYDCSIDEIRDDIIDFLQSLYDSGIIQFDGNYCPTIPKTVDKSESITTDNDDFEGEIINQLESENQLYSATIEMTYACNEKCIHCYAHYPSADLSTDYISYKQYQHFIDELYEMGALHLSFTGGDPFMNKYFIDLFKYSRSKGFVCDIFTNGLWLADHPYELEDILLLRPRAFYISLYGASSLSHDSVTGIPGSFSKTITVAKKIHDANIPVIFNVMLLAENCDEIEGIIKLVDQLGVEYRASMSLIYRNDGSASPLNHFIGNKEKIKNILRIIRKNMFSIDQPIDNLKNNEYMCGAGVTSICLSPDGTIYPCVSLKIPLGNLKTDSLSDVWNSTARSHIVTSLKWDNTTECKFCTRKNICPHCAGMSQAETGDMFSCNTCDKIISECISQL